jgi:hypothetical protein
LTKDFAVTEADEEKRKSLPILIVPVLVSAPPIDRLEPPELGGKRAESTEMPPRPNSLSPLLVTGPSVADEQEPMPKRRSSALLAFFLRDRLAPCRSRGARKR